MTENNELTGQRTRYTIRIGGGEDDVAEYLACLERTISRVAGGCNVTTGAGIWREDGNTQPPYTGDVAREHSATVSFVVDNDTPHKAIKAALIDASNESDAQSVQWVNVEHEPVNVSHIDVQSAEVDA